MMKDNIHISDLSAAAYKVPTDFPESDGTLEWNSTTLILVEIKAAGKSGLGYTYANESICHFIIQILKPLLTGKNAMDITRIFGDMCMAIRNEGQAGMAYMAISAVDNALWDLKAKILELPLCCLIGMDREKILLYGSGGFTSYDEHKLTSQLAGWEEEGFRQVKMKIGRHPDRDVDRVKAVRNALKQDTEIFVDANGAYSVKESLRISTTFQDLGVSWFEEPVPSFDLDGLKFIRDYGSSHIRIAAGEYGYHLDYFLKMLQKKSVDVLQADATRCGGISGFLKVTRLCEAFRIPLSFHCAPAQHLHVSLCSPSFYIGEYFHDHVRIERMFFENVATPRSGYLVPDLTVPGIGISFKKKDAEKYRAI